MKNQKFSVYLALGVIIFATVISIMAITSTYSYINTKEKTIEHMKKDSTTTILSIKDNIKNLIASYSVNEYDNVIYNEISRRDIFAIVIKDYNMGRILGEESLITGKIRNNNNMIIDYDPTNTQHRKELEECFYSQTFEITSNNGKELGKISIFVSDDTMQKELNELIFENIKNSIILASLLILSLFITIRFFILRPISDMVNNIGQTDEDGIPTKLMSNHSIKEVNELSFTINKMISSIKTSRSTLQKEQKRLQSLLELSPIAVRIAKNRGRDVIFANNAYSKLLKVSKQETLHQNPRDFYEDQDMYDEIVNSLNKNGTIYNRLVKLHIDGGIVWALASYMNFNFDGEKGVIGWFYDVSEEKINEAKLYEALELQTTIFDNSGYMIIRTNKDGLIKQVNKETEELLGYTAKELVDKQTPLILHNKSELEQKAVQFSKELKTEIKNDLEVFTKKADLNLANEYEWTYLTKDGKHIPVILSVTALRNKNNEVYGYLGIAKDITQSKLIESQAKLASMGEMIGNIAHQWRQPLSVVSTIASSIKIKNELNLMESEDVNKDMDNIIEQIQYLSKTIDDFRNFIKNKNEKERVYISNIVSKTMSILKSSLKNNDIDIVLDVNEDLEIDGFENQLIQALINIINNSKDAITEKVEDKKSRYIFISTKKKNDDLALYIKDNGGGIKKEVIDKIFEPYFTTKHKSIGTGIGLSMTYQIINDHHDASINVLNETYSHEEKEYTGACFEILFKAA